MPRHHGLLPLAAAAAALAAALTPTLASRPVSNVHLALSSDPTRMHVQWTSAPGDVLGNGSSTLQWGVGPRALTSSAAGRNFSYTSPDTKRVYTFNGGTMTGLQPGGAYFYRVGDPLDGWSAVSSFVATRSAAQFTTGAPLVIGWLGDMGWADAQALGYVQTEAALGMYDHIVHVGDYGYDLQDSNGAVGDAFQASVEPITASVPYMGCEGNHEGGLSFGHYANRFALFAGDNSSGATPANLPGVIGGLPNNHWYSYTVGPVHFLVLSTEAYFFYKGAAAQFAFAEADLAAVDRWGGVGCG